MMHGYILCSLAVPGPVPGRLFFPLQPPSGTPMPPGPGPRFAVGCASFRAARLTTVRYAAIAAVERHQS